MASDLSGDEEEVYGSEEAQEMLFQLLVDLKLRSKLTATDCCVLSYWAVLGGLGGDSLKKLAKKPGDPHTGHYSAKFDSATGQNLNDPNFCYVTMPVYSPAEGARITRPVCTLPPQLTLEDECNSYADFDSALAKYVADMPPAYTTHPVVEKSPPGTVLPLAMYMDGVQYTVRGNLIGVWLVNMVSERRHLVLTLRKGVVCKCGCHGWCTYWQVFHYLNWCCEVLASGVHAVAHPNGQPFRPREKTPCKSGANCQESRSGVPQS